MTTELLLTKIKPDMIKAFSQIPEYGSIGMIIHMREGEPVRIEWSGSTMKKLESKAERGGIR